MSKLPSNTSHAIGANTLPNEPANKEVRAWIPGVDKLEPGESLEYDEECYDLLHRFSIDWPCLSLSIIPHTTKTPEGSDEIYFVSGTQANKNLKNKIYIMKWSSSSPFGSQEEAESGREDDKKDDSTNNSKLSYCTLKNEGTTNRIRICPKINRLVANWSDNGTVSIWDISKQLDLLESSQHTSSIKFLNRSANPALFSFNGHRTEGYALDWNPFNPGCLITGDCNGYLHLWETVEGGWSISSDNKFTGHTQSIEDIKWKARGNGSGKIFATASTDGFLRFFDGRQASSLPSQIINAHEIDVNVLEWNPLKDEMLLSADDQGFCKVWDIRFPRNELALINYHQKPISSISWHPHDDSIFASSSYDDIISFWDLSVEPDNEFLSDKANGNPELPDQLMFLHMGQKQVSEIQWHPTLPGIILSTALDGFNIFKTCNI